MLLTPSCKKDKNPDPVINEYLVSHEKIASKTVLQSKALLGMAGDITGIDELISQIDYDVDIYKVSYNTSFKGSQIIATGLVTVPTNAGIIPILSFQNGTNVKHSKAPSVDPSNLLFQMLESVAGSGFMITLPDYIGSGSSSDMLHPYYYEEGITPSILDLIRAGKELAAEIEIQTSDDLYLMGYSEGGWATLQAMAQIENNLSNEFNLKATASGAGAYDLKFVNDYILTQETYLQPYYLPYVLLAYQSVEIITNSLSDVFNEPYFSAIPELFNGNFDGNEINAALTTSIADLLTDGYRNDLYTDPKFSDIVDALEDNSVNPWILKSPLALFHGDTDASVPFSTSELMKTELLEAGSQESMIELIPILGGDHAGSILPMGIEAMLWFLEIKN